jgi:hypothetical protein
VKNRWLLLFVLVCGLALVLDTWLRTLLRGVPLEAHVASTVFLVGAYIGLVMLSLESPNPSAGRTGSHRRSVRPDIALPWWQQTALAGLLAVVVAMLWRADATGAATIVGIGLLAGATAHWWIALMLIDPWRR